MSNQIKKYLYNYILDIKYNKLAENLHNSKQLYKTVSKFVDKYTIRNPRIIDVLYGGGLNDKELNNKMSRIAAIFSKYKNLNFNEIKHKADELNDELDKLIKEIDSLDPNNVKSIEAVKMSDEIINNLEDIRVNAVKFSKGIKINIDKFKLGIPIDKLFLSKLPDEDYFTQIIGELTKKVNDNIININNGTKLSENQLKLLGDEIDKYDIKLEETRKTLDSLLIKLIDNNKNTSNSYIYTFKNNEVVNVLKINELFGKIKSVPNDSIFFMTMNNKYAQFLKKNIKERDFVQQYNDIITIIDFNKYDLPQQYFNGKYAKRITNNFLMNDFDINSKLDTLHNIIKDDDIKYIKPHPNIDTFKGIYAPDFLSLKDDSDKDDKSGSLGHQAPKLIGGSNVMELTNKMSKLTGKIAEYLDELSKYKKQVKIYNKFQIQILTHTMFLVLIVTNQLFTTDYVIYDYINKGTITFYNRIVENIIKKINDNVSSDEILYFKKYHMVTLLKLSSFLDQIGQHTNADDIIDIRRCTGETANRFLLLNYFKSILESYREQYQNSITIYARINDIKQPIDFTDIDRFMNQKMFMSDYERLYYATALKQKNITDTNFMTLKTGKFNLNKEDIDSGVMYIKASTCDALSKDIEKGKDKKFENLDWMNMYKFTEVFDSLQFPMNGDISKYMTLDTQLSKGKGVAIMTYGYSGTGKTYTLFGSHKDNKEGILQSTLDNINGLRGVKFRLFELYGYGLTYPHYWKNETTGLPRVDSIAHEIYKYDISVKPDVLAYENVSIVVAKDIAKYISDHTGEHQTYAKIPENIVSDIFRNFDTFMNEIELVRQGKNKDGTLKIGNSEQENNQTQRKRRIRDTPNNIVSSRSVLVYDFILEIGDKNVPFLIIDLPGREEIVQTYIDPFLNNQNIIDILKKSELNGQKFNDKILFIKTLLATMAINPVAVPIFAYETENKGVEITNIVVNFINNHKDRKIIFDTKLNFTFETTNIVSKDQKEFTLLEEIINKNGTQLSNFFSIAGDKQLTLNDKRSGFGYSRTNSYQYLAMIGIHIMNRLIILNRFDMIYELYVDIINKHLNKYLISGIDKIPDNNIGQTFANLKTTNFKGEIISSIKTEHQTKNILKEIIKYDYYLTPFEGIYINENIAGLIKYLAETMITNEADRKVFLENLKNKMSQPEGLNFQYQQKMARIWLMTNGSKGTHEIQEFYGLDTKDSVISLLSPDSNIDFNTENLQKVYNSLTTSYKSNGIFNFDKPLITDILNPYTQEIKDYKVFYLFGNYADAENGDLRNLKCSHQYSLLENTKDFIETIVKN
jgi:hypothetical protein